MTVTELIRVLEAVDGTLRVYVQEGPDDTWPRAVEEVLENTQNINGHSQPAVTFLVIR